METTFMPAETASMFFSNPVRQFVKNQVAQPSLSVSSQVCQVSAQQPVQTELLMRYHQLQSRLATLKIENEEVKAFFKCTFI